MWCPERGASVKVKAMRQEGESLGGPGRVGAAVARGS